MATKMTMQAGRAGGDVGKPDWNLYDGSGNRTTKIHVNFATVFVATPTVAVSICRFDMIDGHNQRLDVSATEVTQNGFDVVFNTWEDTKVFSATVQWTAFGEVNTPTP